MTTASRYGALRKKNAGDQTLKTEQRVWIKRRNRDRASGNVECLIESYEKRLAELNKPAWD